MISIVSGLPRSGTSLMMQMLVAGGMAALTDHLRRPDEDNPRGYHEWEPIKRLPQAPGLIVEAEGKVVKVVSQLLLSLPVGQDYKIVFMERPMQEVLASQESMLRRRGSIETPDGFIAEAFTEHLREVASWLMTRNDLSVCRIGYRRLLQNPMAYATEIQAFLGVPLDVVAMVKQVDLGLYRNRG